MYDIGTIKPSAETAKSGRGRRRSLRRHFSIESVNTRKRFSVLVCNAPLSLSAKRGVPMVYDHSLTASRSYVMRVAQAAIED